MGLFGGRKKSAEVEVIEMEVKAIEQDFRKEISEIKAAGGHAFVGGSTIQPDISGGVGTRMPGAEDFIKVLIPVLRDMKILEHLKSQDPVRQQMLRKQMKMDEAKILREIQSPMFMLNTQIQVLKDSIGRELNSPRKNHLMRVLYFLERLFNDFQRVKQTVAHVS